MPFLKINELNLFYETFGEARPSGTPIVLIHGSTDTGAGWGLVPALLAQKFFVIVPDCRGHGRSSNPQQTYSFSEMAADTAGLVRALGFERAHIIGHSNGGNVALLTLMEHPDVVQTAVIQAGNAYVSQDLIDKEPAYFDPERVMREEPEWLSQMQAAHSPTHGPEYWRTLLKMTCEEILSGPNYTPDDLADVERPVLIIQGAQDRANAPGEHAQYMHAHLPLAECWIPENTGHNVHEELLFEWIDRVTDFIERRGDTINDTLYRLGKTRFFDSREFIYDVHAKHTVDEHGMPIWEVNGNVLYSGQVSAIEKAIHPATPNEKVLYDIKVLLSEPGSWALVRRGVADLRREPRSLAERVSQVVLGESVRILEVSGDWSFVRLNQDGYMGWTQTRVLHPCSEEETLVYQRSRNATIIAELASVFAEPEKATGDRTLENGHLLPGKLAFATRIWITAVENGWARAILPDGQNAWLKIQDCLTDDAPRPTIADALKLISRSAGAPYLWGGRTPFGYDCSGFAQAFHAFLGTHIPRDADQQFRTGQPIEDIPEPGDLIFFGSPASNSGNRFANVTHVAISLGGWEIIHANGTAWGVSFNSLSPDSPRYSAWLADHNLGVRRFL